MKYIIILGDGMSDYPLDELGGKTPLMVAVKPNIDMIAKKGRTGLFETIAQDMPTGSAVANLSVLGYDPALTFRGRGVLEAASLGVQLSEKDIAMRVNLINIAEEKIISHSAGHITTEEARVLIDYLSGHFSKLPVRLHPGLSYRHLLLMNNGDPDLECFPPHDHINENYKDLLIRPLTENARDSAALLNDIIIKSQYLLAAHPVNNKRIDEGKQPANSLWPWSPGRKPRMRTFQDRFGISGTAISAVDLIKGLAIYAGLDTVDVKGATGLYDTNYEGKADACLESLKTHDFVFVHVEAADEAGHSKDLALKIKCIEDLDSRLVKKIMENAGEDTAIAILPDHPTPVALGCHTKDPVPVAIMDPRFEPDSVQVFDECSVKDGSLGLLKKDGFINTLIKGRLC